MPCTLTQHRRPHPHYGLRQIAGSAWSPLGGWYLHADNTWRRVWTVPGRRVRTARRAVVAHVGGLWCWKIEVFDLSTRQVRRIADRGSRGYLMAEMAFPFADLSAKTAD